MAHVGRVICFPRLLARIICIAPIILLSQDLWLSDDAHAAEITIHCDPQQPIPALGNGPGDMNPVTLDMTEQLSITDLRVYVDIQHTDVTDLRVVLTAPWGDSITLKEPWEPDWRSPRPNMTGTIFDDHAATFLPDGDPPFADDFRPPPGQYLSQFAQHNASGVWTLNIRDVYAADAGTLHRWELRFLGTHAPEPATVCFMFLLVVLSRLRCRPTTGRP